MTYYSIKEYRVEGNVLVKPNQKVKVSTKIGSSYMFFGDSEGMLSEKIFNSIFSPFKLNEIVFHKFYGIGQIVGSSDPNNSSSVIFFCNPKQKYELGDTGIPLKDISR